MKQIINTVFSRKNISSTILFLLCIAFFAVPPITYGPHNISVTSKVTASLLYSFCHINIFHMAVNLWALYSFRPRISTAVVSFIIAILVSLLQVAPNPVPTCGISVLLYAAISRYYVAWKVAPYRPLFFNVFLCGINFLLDSVIYNFMAHLFAFSVGWLCWWSYYKYKSVKQSKNERRCTMK